MQMIIWIISFTILGITIGYMLGYNNGRLKKRSISKRKSQRIVRKDKPFVELSKDKNPFMREILASDSRTPDEVLIGLSKDEDTLVRIKAKRELKRRGK